MAQHTPKVDPMSKLVGFASALVLLVVVFYFISSLMNTVDKNSLEGQVVEKPESKEEETKTASADEKSGGDEKSSGGSGGDIAAGKEKYASCAACHGADGKGQGGAFPVLTGIPANEAEKKLAAYRDGDQEYLKSVGLGDRYGTMAPNAANLSDADIADLAAYIGDEFGGGAGGSSDGGDSAGGNGGGAVDGDVAAGKEAYASCAACHGADGNGQGGAFPVLTEMDAADIQKKLTAYREGDQEYLKSVGLGDRYGTMAPNASNLSDEQIANLSVYIADAFGGTNGGGSAGGEQAKADEGASEKAEPAEPVIVSESMINHGQALFSNCAICHGENGAGASSSTRRSSRAWAWTRRPACSRSTARARRWVRTPTR
ncbi:c-type cytochrome [Guyparkeria sp. SB14A]|uniref:c-type cytochrome n=1 Tax=Guyparkeria sp. SB14A TaxID=2571147 RepID=UPI0010ACD776|nr:c-type cytochrome [Guyparkeria sp. SB14A]TKA88422.1 c-type cytochrome [Guyparkeria sp. SB14A]